VRLEGDNVDAFIDLGIAYMEQGFYAEAERSFQKASEVAPNEVLAVYHLAALYAAWDRPADAIRHLESALALDPDRVRDWVASDRMLDSLREDPELARLLHE
jgi:tetratricopeptide (TPR) repeat protein